MCSAAERGATVQANESRMTKDERTLCPRSGRVPEDDDPHPGIARRADQRGRTRSGRVQLARQLSASCAPSAAAAVYTRGRARAGRRSTITPTTTSIEATCAPLHGAEFADECDDQRRVLCRIGCEDTRSGSASGFVIEADRRCHISEVGVGLRHEV
jgi:hypothetical protein